MPIPKSSDTAARMISLVRKNINYLTGVVTHAHRCESTVRVRVMKQVWNKKLRKYFTRPTGFLADDYKRACVAGDVVSVACGNLRTSSTKRHVVDKIVAPARTGEVRTEPEGVMGWIMRRAANKERVRKMREEKRIEAERVRKEQEEKYWAEVRRRREEKKAAKEAEKAKVAA